MPNLWKFLSIFLVFSSVYAKHCTIVMPRDVPQPTPIILTNTGLFRPTSTVTTIVEHDKITLLCTGRDNTVLALNEEIVTLVCENGNFFHNNKTYALQNMKCKSVPTTQLWRKGTTCATGDGVFYEVGIDYKNRHAIFEICFNQRDQRTIYSRHLINGYIQNGRPKYDCRPSFFRSEGMSRNLNDLYTKSTQQKHFETLFGVNQTFNNNASFLARGHIAPFADLIFCYEQFATFYYANVAPEWQIVNAGNWVRVENAVRKIASSQRSDLLVFTGTLGVLELRNPLTSRDTSIYLDEHQTIAVPKWFYKVVMHPSFAIDIVFITLNNPFVRNAVGVEFCNNICRQICKKHSLDCTKFTDTKKGYTFCCELKNFWANAMGVGTPYYELPVGWSYKN
uniref:Nuclease EXOG, mitochondrial n=1 Tax=Bactrocera latifrons TaxID=174628 RepID=A0A0K8WFE1_BACLA